MMHKDNQLEGLSPEERYEQRKEKIAPLVDEYFDWIKENRPNVTRQSKTGKANDLKPYEYLKHLLTEIPKHMDDTNMDFLE